MQTIIETLKYGPAKDADNGNRFLTGNGYMGARGTLCEASAKQMAAINLAGIHHQKGSEWEEPLNAPNPLFFRVKGCSLPENAELVQAHRLTLDIACGRFLRETTFRTANGNITLTQERFCAMDQVHLLAQQITLLADEAQTLVIEHGVDTQVWDIHGPHYDTVTVTDCGETIVACGVTDNGLEVATASWQSLPHGNEPSSISESTITLAAGTPWVFTSVSAVFTSRDCADPAKAALSAVKNAPSYAELLSAQQASWQRLWDDARVEIDGDERAEFAINYSLYHLISITPRHAHNLSVPARGLSGQTYKGAIFWDTEMFMLDFYLNCMPQVAKSCLQYRIDSLPEARKKAAQYGLRGAFYAWESVENGKEACSDYNVTDVFTGRPMRTFFRDKQVHISAAVVYGLRKYAERTADDTLMRDGGAQTVLECARFYFSLISKKLMNAAYDLNDVIGPDEYHERVNNNAYTNEMARMTLRYAVQICPIYLADVSADELRAFADATDHLKEQRPDPATKVIQQFDGYFHLEDASVDAVRARLLNPKEYWGGVYGVAAQTRVIKQADVMAMLYLLDAYPTDVVAANYDYYEPRTEHGSSLSACMYTLCACRIARPEAAYPLFMKSAEADMVGGGKQWAGLVYIGGTHPAAAGGAYMVLLYGFLGLRMDGGIPTLHPRLPEGWRQVRLHIRYCGKTYLLSTAADTGSSVPHDEARAAF